MSRKMSVVLATYNGFNYLEQAIDSVLAQTYDNFEFVVIDDASTDRTAELLAEYAKKRAEQFSYITLPENLGQGEAFNRGIAATTGEIVSFLDSDDYWYPNKLETVARDFGDVGKTAIHQHHLHLLSEGQVKSKTVRSALLVGDLLAYAREVGKIQGNFVPSSGLSMSRSALNWVGPIPPEFRICADGYLTRTTMCYGRVCASDEALGAYRIHDCNHTVGNGKWDNAAYVNNLLIPHLHAFYAKRAINVRYVLTNEQKECRYAEGMAWLALGHGDHVAVMRVAPPDIMITFLQSLRKAGVKIHLLAPESVRAAYENHCYQFYGIHDGVIGPQTISDKVVGQLRRINLRYVLLPYAMLETKYENVQKAVLAMRLDCPSAGISMLGNILPCKPVDEDKVEIGTAFSQQIKTNEQRLLAIRNKFKGRRAFLIGNGPSLTMSDLDRLKDEITIASNKIYLAFDETDWRPTVYCVCDEVVARNNHDAICRLPQPKVFTQSVMKYLWNAPLASYMPPQTKSRGQHQLDVAGWDLVAGCNAGHSVLNMSIKVACWMGIREIYIIGADHSFVVPDTRTGERIMNNAVLQSRGEVNHFHPNYRQKGEEWTMPKLSEIENDFQESKEIFESIGGKIWNASRFTKLDVFDRIDFDEALRRTP